VRGFRSGLTYSNVMATIAVFVALGGGAYAVSVPRNSVGAKQLKNRAVSSAKIKHGAITTRKVRDRSLLARDFKPKQLPALGGAHASDLAPPPAPGGVVVQETTLTLDRPGRVHVLATLRDMFLTCRDTACFSRWGVYVDGRPVPDTGVRLEAPPGNSDGFSFYTVFGLTASELSAGAHAVRLARLDSGSIDSVGQLGAQLEALAVG
jgi:hypothetical protein